MLKITKAVYGGKDVTQLVIDKVADDRISLLVSNNLFGDPMPNVVKYLDLNYVENGRSKEVSFREGTMCMLPVKPKEVVLYNGKPRKVKFIIPFPDLPYYLWQILVQINNFRKMGYEVETHYPVVYMREHESPSAILKNLMDSVNIKAKFHLYHDTREDVTYSASMKPWLMAQYFKEFPEEKDNVYVYLDPDVIFLKPIDWTDFINDDIWYEADTSGYLHSPYIKSKGEQLFIEMCDIFGISPAIVEANDVNCGGAQYITKNNTFEFWDEVEKTSVPLYKHMVATADKYRPEKDPYSIQAWTAEMWTTNWTLWKHGVQTKIIDELNFHMVDHAMEQLRHNFFHNTGTMVAGADYFNKTMFQISPFNKETPCSANSISYKYVEEIKETEKNFPELMF